MTNHPSKKYPLLPFSQLVYDVMRWTPQIYRFRHTERISGGAMHTYQWQEAISEALYNHPVFSARIDLFGKHYASKLKDILCGKYHHVSFRTDGADLLIDVEISRILGDGKSVKILREDIERAFRGEELEPDNYWGYLEYVEKEEQSQHYKESRDWLQKEFADESVPVRPTIDRHLWTLFPPKAGLLQNDYSDLREKINRLAKTEYLSLDGFFSLCAALAIAEYCGTESAALTWAYEGRERPEEQRIFGSLHRDIPFKINRESKITNHKSDLIREARNQIRSGIAHSDYPYTLTAPYSKRWNYAVNVLRVLDNLPPQKYAYALLDIEIHEKSERSELWFRYSATHYKPESIQKFAALVRKYAEWLLTDQ